ncbi:hypothetical protein JXI42_13050, partial [bacterium]|nr:hypothetical protein [bacterium]
LSQLTGVLTAGTYYLTIEGLTSSDCGDYVLDIYKECVPDFTVTAPYISPIRNFCGESDDCDLQTGPEHIYEVIIPADGDYAISTCLLDDFDTWLGLGTDCCLADIAENDDSCGLQSTIIVSLVADTYYVTVEGIDTCGDYILEIWDTTTPDIAVCLTTDSWDAGTLNVSETNTMEDGDEISIENCGTFPFDLGLRFLAAIDTTTWDTIPWIPGNVISHIDTFIVMAQFTDLVTVPAAFNKPADLVIPSLKWSTATIYGPAGFNIPATEFDYLWLEFLSPAFSSTYDVPIQICILLRVRPHLP